MRRAHAPAGAVPSLHTPMRELSAELHRNRSGDEGADTDSPQLIEVLSDP